MEPGTKVLVEFDTSRWPIHKATYTYEGHDDNVWWMRRKDGVQRCFERADVISVTPVEEEIEESPY